LTRLTKARHTGAVPTVAIKPVVLWEVADVVEQIFTLAMTCDLRTVTPEDHEAAVRTYQAEHDLPTTRLREVLRSSLTAMREVDELGRQAKLMRIYMRCWRPCEPEGRKPCRARANVHAEERRARKAA